MGKRLKLVLDPPGYYRAEEPGFHWYITGRKVAEIWDGLPSTGKPPFWMFSPDGSQWLLPWPLQWTPGWYADPRLGNYVCRLANWVFAQGVGPPLARESEPTKYTAPGSLTSPGGAQQFSWPDNQWIYVPGVPQFAPLDNTNFTQMFGAAGVAMPQGLGVIAYTDLLPNGGGAIRDASHTPYWQVLRYPPPNDFFCFGFHELAFILYQDEVVALRTASPGDNQHWVVMKRYTRSASPTADGGRSITSGTSPRTPYLFREQAFTFIPGIDDLHLYMQDAGKEAHWAVPLHERSVAYGTIPELFTGLTPFWVAAYPTQELGWQTQVVGYYEGIFNEPGPPPYEMFSLGERYRPTVKPNLGMIGQISAPNYGTEAQTDYYDYGVRFSAPNGCMVEAYLLDDTGALWASNGSNYKGGVYVHLKPSDDTYLPASLRHFEARWPVKLVERECLTVELSDSEFRNLRVETSWREPGGKRLSAAVTARAAAKIKDGLGKRDYYPVHLVRYDDAPPPEDEEPGGDPPEGEEILARAWVANSNNDELRSDSVENPREILAQRIGARGLLVRGEQEPLFLPQLVDPSGAGRITYVFAFKEVLQQIGFDPEDADLVGIDSDWMIGESGPPCEVVCLPGTWAFQPGESELKVNSPWAMDWGESFTRYLERIVTQWRGWLLFETMAKIRLGPDQISAGAIGDVTVTVHSTKVAATAAGTPGQYYASLSEEIRPPEANCVRVTGRHGSKPVTLRCIDRDMDSITDPTAPNYLGEAKVATLTPKLAIGDGAVAQMARVALLRKRRRVCVDTVSVPIAPWEFKPVPVDVGVPVTISGRGVGVVAHMEFVPDKAPGSDGRAVYRTRLVVERQPAAPAEPGA
ncbi:MAG TPA: hypothetical protein PLE61_15290 [Vicinamibacterales bacterium]|nr:hypothetical protein [Vicinamibacterales bacterium]